MQTSAAGRKQDESKRSARTCRFRKTWHVTDAWTYPPHHICLFAHKPWYLSLCLPNVAIPARFSTGLMHACEGAMKSSSPVNLSPAENDIFFVQECHSGSPNFSRLPVFQSIYTNQSSCCKPSTGERKQKKKTKKKGGSRVDLRIRWEIPLMVVFFATSMGAQIPVIAEKPLSTCGFKKFLYTCTTHWGTKKTHDGGWLIKSLTFSTQHTKWKKKGV